MNRIFRLPGAVKIDSAIADWMKTHSNELGSIAVKWFLEMRNCGDDVKEILHDGYPTACINDVAFAYVGVFKAHVNVGFFCGTELKDPKNLLEGTGKYMRHIKLKPGKKVDEESLRKLIKDAYSHMRSLVERKSRSV